MSYVEKLSEIPQMILSSDEDWQYRITAFSDVVEIEYLEGGEVKTKYHIPTFCAVQVGEVIQDLAKRAPDFGQV